MKKKTTALAADAISSQILILRGQRVILDSDLAALYGVTTKRFNEQVHRNAGRFPPDFMFQLSNQDLAILRSQFATSRSGPVRAHWGGRRSLPHAFTEHGAIMAASVLNSARAIEVSVYVVRAFVQLREMLATHKAFSAKLEELEEKTEALALRHDTLAAQTRTQLRHIFDALRELMNPTEPERRPIGFISPEVKKP